MSKNKKVLPLLIVFLIVITTLFIFGYIYLRFKPQNSSSSNNPIPTTEKNERVYSKVKVPRYLWRDYKEFKVPEDGIIDETGKVPLYKVVVEATSSVKEDVLLYKEGSTEVIAKVAILPAKIPAQYGNEVEKPIDLIVSLKRYSAFEPQDLLASYVSNLEPPKDIENPNLSETFYVGRKFVVTLYADMYMIPDGNVDLVYLARSIYGSSFDNIPASLNMGTLPEGAGPLIPIKFEGIE